MRQRELSYDINTLMKYKIIKNNNIEKNESKFDDNYEILKDYTLLNMKKKEPVPPFHQKYNIPFKPPKYEFQKRMYVTKDKHLKFHQKASIVKLEQGVGNAINSSQKNISFLNLMAMFDEDEINEFEFDKLLNMNKEESEKLKEKLGKIIDFVENCDCPDKLTQQQVVGVLNEKMQQIKNNENNIDIVTDNIQNIEKIVYGKEGIKVVLYNK